MSASIIQIRDYQPKRDLARLAELERQALEIINVALMGEPGMVGMEPVIYINETVPYGGAGIDGMDLGKEPA